MEKKHHLRLSVFTLTPERIDQFLSHTFGWSRSKVKRLIQDGQVLCNQTNVRASQHVKKHDQISLFETISHPIAPVNATIKKQTIISDDWTIPILFSDDHIMIVNKPSGLVVHGAPSVSSVSLVDIVLSAGINLYSDDSDRLGIVHRLYQFTEGVLILVKSEAAFNAMKAQFKARDVTKYYYAVLQGVLSSKEGVIDRPIGRDRRIRARQSCHQYVEGSQKSALTRYKVLREYTNLSFVDVDLVSGRTHQIRVHFSALNCPVLGDALYSKQSKKLSGYFLQSYYLKFFHPISKEVMEFRLPVSERLKKYADPDSKN